MLSSIKKINKHKLKTLVYFYVSLIYCLDIDIDIDDVGSLNIESLDILFFIIIL